MQDNFFTRYFHITVINKLFFFFYINQNNQEDFDFWKSSKTKLIKKIK